MASIRKLRRLGMARVRRSQRWSATVGCTAAACGVGNHSAAATPTAPEPISLPASADLIETPAHINRLAWAWLREFQRDLQDDCDNRLEANNH